MGRKLLIIGGVAGGTSAAGRARRTDPELEITIFEKGNYVSYGACDEPNYISGEIESWRNLLVRSPEQFKKKQNIDICLNHEVTEILPSEKKIRVRDLTGGGETEHEYDSLVIATGARPRHLDIPGSDAPNIFRLKILDDARAINDFIVQQKPKRAVVYGAGFISLEMTEAFIARGIQVNIIYRGTRPGGPVDKEISDLVREEIKQRGIEYHESTTIESFSVNEDGLCNEVVANNGTFPTDLVLVATGVVPNVEEAVRAGIELGPTGAIAVDEHQATNLPDIYCAGDCCESTHRVGNYKIYTPLGDVANKQGWTAGENAAGGKAVYPGSLGSWQYKFFDLEIGATGLTEAKARSLEFEVYTKVVDHFSRAHAQPRRKPIKLKLIADKKTHRLLGAQIGGYEGAAIRINSLAVAIYAELTVDRLAEVDFAYAPPFSPVMDPILVAARVAAKGIDK
jgi:CoA-dependent NAD(P)H sulfur oxidoreductase